VSWQVGGFKILKGISLEVRAGSITGLIGPNGSGKTTLFNVISGYIRPTSGAVLLGDRNICALSVQERGRLGIVRTFQTPRVFEDMTVLENVMVGATKRTATGFLGDLLGRSSSSVLRSVQRMAEEECERFGLSRLNSRLAGTLTGGQRRVLEIARAYVGRPGILMLDEPSSGLNDDEIASLRHWIKDLNGEGMSILLVSHDMELMNVVQTTAVLSFGEVIASGCVDDVKRDQRVQDVYLGV
jgi:ABC-type branched-subunit amino acid transport system ATPase component